MIKLKRRPLRVLIADDHAIIRRGLKRILQDTHDKITIDEAENGNEVLEMVAKTKYNIILLDISMSGRNGLDILKQIKQENIKQKILIISIHPEELYAIRALKAGADGYLNKGSTPDKLLSAIYDILNGETHVTSSIVQRLILDLKAARGKLPHETLSDREYEILHMIAEGKTMTRISHELSLSVKTISTYRTRLLEKMNMDNNMQLTRYAMEYDLLDSAFL
jgi:DNA-binding NarL/FixJ family response regulator